MTRIAFPAGPHTAETVRRDLPDVTVSRKGKTYPARIINRRADFAVVVWDDGLTAEWAWGSIANALNAGAPLLF